MMKRYNNTRRTSSPINRKINSTFLGKKRSFGIASVLFLARSIQCEGFVAGTSFAFGKQCGRQTEPPTPTEAILLKSPTLNGKLRVGSEIIDQGYNNKSHIERIICFNLGGVVSTEKELEGSKSSSKEILIEFGDYPNLVAVTGETGSGKSLLVSKAIDLVLGGKASASMVHMTEHISNASVEVGESSSII